MKQGNFTISKKILFLTYYFPPDLSAGSFRAEALVQALVGESNSIQIDVITSMPNRYHEFNTEAASQEVRERVSIRRIDVPGHSSEFFGQVRSFIWFAFTAYRLTRQENYDLVFATSSRLMTATLGAFIARRMGCALYLDIRDIFLDVLPELLPSGISNAMGAVFSRVEKWTLKSATKVNMVSSGFLPYFQHRYPELSYSVFTNGIDPIFVDSFRTTYKDLPVSGEVRVLYAGNIGEGQGLDQVLPMLAKQMTGKVRFRVLGAGGGLNKLKKALAVLKVDNVELLPPVSRGQLLKFYQDADVLFVHLNSFKAFERVLPSKLFEYAATGKPIWAGLGGYPAEFVRENLANAVVFEPCDVVDAVRVFGGLKLGVTNRVEFVEAYSRVVIMKQMSKDILAHL